MKIGRCSISGKTYYCVIKGQEVHVLSVPPFTGIVYDGRVVQRSETMLLPPVEPTKIVAVGLNYRAHAKEFGKPMPDEPLIFIKPPTSVIGDGDGIVYPGMSGRVDYEGELAVVIGRRAKDVTVAEAGGYVFGLTIMNDVTARDLQAKDVQYTRAKGFDTFAPIGPHVETELEPDGLSVKTYVNGVLRQEGNTSDMQFSVYHIISFVSHVMTLVPGDVISTGTPPGIGPVKRGDIVEVEIQGIGRLHNRVV